MSAKTANGYHGNLCLPAQVTGYWVTTGSRPLRKRLRENAIASMTKRARRVFANVIRTLVTGNLVTIAGRRVTNRLPRRGPGQIKQQTTRAYRVVTPAVTDVSVLQHCTVRRSRKLPVGIAWVFLGSTMFCTWAESARRAYEYRHTPGRGTIGLMAARDPFQLDRDQTERDTEYGYGAGKFPDPHFDYSGGGSISQIPIADPTRHEQELELAMIRRTDVSDPNDQPSPYVCGNTDRFGAQPPLVRETKPPKYTRPQRKPPSRMQRQW